MTLGTESYRNILLRFKCIHRRNRTSHYKLSIGHCFSGKLSSFLIILRNAYVHSVVRLRSCLVLNQIVYVVTIGLKGLIPSELHLASLQNVTSTSLFRLHSVARMLRPTVVQYVQCHECQEIVPFSRSSFKFESARVRHVDLTADDRFLFRNMLLTKAVQMLTCLCLLIFYGDHSGKKRFL